MNRERVVLVATVGLLLGVTFASGPIVGISLTEPKSFAPGSGSVNASVTETPETAVLERGNHGAGVYYLRSAPIDVQVTNVTGQPFLTYELSIPELGYTSASLTYLDDGSEGEVRLEFQPGTVDAEDVGDGPYDGVLTVLVTDDAGARTIAETNVTIEVEG